MQQSVYTKISKSIGLQGTAEITTIEKAYELLKALRNGDAAESRSAFREIFKIYRFAPSPTCKAESDALDVICTAYKEGDNFYRNVQD